MSGADSIATLMTSPGPAVNSVSTPAAVSDEAELRFFPGNPVASVAVAVAAQWLLPGLGYVLGGQRIRGVILGMTVLGLFWMGVLIGGVRVIDLPDIRGPGSLVARLTSKLPALGAFWAGPSTLVAGQWSASLAANPETAAIKAHARAEDIGGLYASVAGMMNLLAMIDLASRAARGGGK